MPRRVVPQPAATKPLTFKRPRAMPRCRATRAPPQRRLFQRVRLRPRRSLLRTEAQAARTVMARKSSSKAKQETLPLEGVKPGSWTGASRRFITAKTSTYRRTSVGALASRSRMSFWRDAQDQHEGYSGVHLGFAQREVCRGGQGDIRGDWGGSRNRRNLKERHPFDVESICASRREKRHTRITRTARNGSSTM